MTANPTSETRSLASGSIKPGKGKPSREVAEEFAESDKPGKLPARAKSKSKGKK
jgi:hypothetical protein